MDKLFEQFLREKTYRVNLQPRTLDIYRQTFARYFKGMEPTKVSVQECVIRMREKGLADSGQTNTAKTVGKKLKSVRLEREWTQQQMPNELGRVSSPPDSAMISRYKRGEREPSLFVLLAYGQVAGLVVDVFINDRITVENFQKMLQ